MSTMNEFNKSNLDLKPNAEESHQHTYETIQAKNSSETLYDPIIWDPDFAYRGKDAYRKLHHQNGQIGSVNVRLLEGRDLKRLPAVWSVLGLGPVKHLGLSKAVGEVSSYVAFSLYHDSHTITDTGGPEGDKNSNILNELKIMFDSTSHYQHHKYQSSVVSNCNNPTWNVKTKSNFSIPILKSDAPRQSSNSSNSPSSHSNTHCLTQIYLRVVVYEERTAAESFLSLRSTTTHAAAAAASSNQNSTSTEIFNNSIVDAGNVLGYGVINLTSYIKGEYDTFNSSNTASDNKDNLSKTEHNSFTVAGGVLDAWINIRHPSQYYENSKTSEEEDIGKIHVLLTYEPIGIEPKVNDIVALESFARVNLTSSSCIPILPPFQPLRIIRSKYPFILVEFKMSTSKTNHQYREQTNNQSNNNSQKMGRLLLHRNCIFVIERFSVVDHTLNSLVLSPVDTVISHPLGRDAITFITPYCQAAGDVVQPALLGGKLMVNVLKTASGAGLQGAITVASVMAQNVANGVEQKKYEANRKSRNHNIVSK